MRRLLLDTEALIWWDSGDKRLGVEARALIQGAAEVYVSAASAWEIAIKMAIGKLKTTRRVSQVVAEASFGELPITFQHAEAIETLPTHHTDPFDRLILVSAQVEGLTIVSSDRQFAQYNVQLVNARE